MHLESRLVVDVDILLLRDSEEGLVVQPANRSCCLLELDLGVQSTRVPVEGADVTLATGYSEVTVERNGSA